MRILSEYLAEATPRPSPRDRSGSFDLDICTEEFLAADSSRVCDARAGHADEVRKGFIAENLTFPISHRIADSLLNVAGNVDDDDDDDDLQWANARLPLRPVSRRSGYGLYRPSNTWGKENKASFTRKLASSSMGISRHPYSGPLRPHSGPFSGPLTLAKQSTCGKSNRVPSIIPTNLLRRKVLGFKSCEPMSPEVTCLGRIKCKELNSSCKREQTDGDGLSVDSQTVQKSRCFETKNQLCGKRCKGRKKKEKARRRFASTDLKSISDLGQTRREKAATLARSLTGMLEDMRRFEKESVHYEPSVPPPNSLLLMRGCRSGDKDMSIDSGGDEQGINGSAHMGFQDEPIVPPPNSLLLMRGCRTRGNLSLPRDLLMGRGPLQTKHVQACTTSIIDDFKIDAHHVKKLKARAARHLSLLDLIDKEENIMDAGVSISEAADTVSTEGSNALHKGSSTAGEGIGADHEIMKEKVVHGHHYRSTLCQRRSFGELPQIEVKLCARMDR